MPLLPPREAPSRSPQSRQLQNQISTQPSSPERALSLWQEETEHSASVALVSASVALVSLMGFHKIQRSLVTGLCPFANLYRGSQVAKQLLVHLLTQRGQGCCFEEGTISVCETS